jgi:hypothetical protein
MQGPGAATSGGAATGGADRRARTLPKLCSLYLLKLALFIFSWHAAHADGVRCNPAPAHLADDDRRRRAHAAAHRAPR